MLSGKCPFSVVMVKNKNMIRRSWNMANTALGAENTKKENILFISEAHEKFYYEKLKEVRYQDVYHKALCYCLSISDDTRRNIKSIYDFKTGNVKTECLHRDGRPAEAPEWCVWHLISIVTEHPAFFGECLQ